MGESVSSNPLVQLRELFDSLPSGLRQLVEMAVFAGELPRQDVSRMRSMAADLRAGAASLDFHAADLARISAQLDSVGAFGDGVREALRTHRQGAGTLRDDALFMADQVDAAANDAEKTLCVMYAFGIALVWRIARTLAAAAVAGPGGQLAAAPAVESTLAEGRAEFIGMRAALKQAYERIATALKQAYRQVGTETAIRRAAVWAPRLAVGLGKAAALPVAVDAGVQGWQVLRGYRDPVAIGPNGENPRGIDTESLWAAGASGVGGALGGMFAGRFIPKLTAQFAPTIGNRLQRSPVLQGLVNGGVGAGTGLLAATVVTGWPQNFGQVLAPLLNGGFAGAVHAHPAAHSGPGARVDGGGPFTRPDRVGTGHALDRNNSAVRESATAPVQKSPEAKRVQDNAKAEWRETPGTAAAERERIPTPTPGSKTESTAPQGSRSDDSPPTAHREASRRDPAERSQSAQASPRPEKPAPVEALPRNQPAPSTHTVTQRPIEAGRETAPPPRISASGPAGRELETIAAPGDHRTAGNEAHGWPGKQRNLTVESHRETSAGAHPAVASGGTHTSVGTADHGSLNGEQGRTGKPVGADSTAVSTAGQLSAGTVEQVSPNEDAAAAHDSASEQSVTEAGTRPAEGDDPSTADRDSDERIDEPQAQSNANIAAADEYRASVLAETGARLESARDHLTKTREQWEKSRTAFHGEVANHEARVRGELGKSIEAVQGRVTAARKAWQDSRNEYDKESHSSEPREEHLERLRSDIDERISRLREEMVERAALLRAAPGDHRAELEAARSEYGGLEREAREFRESEFRAGRPSLTDRITRWFGREHTGAAEDAAFESAVSKRERELREWLDARESEAQAQLLGELKEKLDACTAEYTEAQEEFRRVGLDVLNNRLAVLNEVGRADMDALDAGLLDRDRAFAAVSTKQKEALSAFLEAANAYDAEAWRSDEVVQRIPDSKVLDSLNDGTPAERFAAAREYIRRADSEGRDLRDTQLQAIASRWSNLRTGEGKGLVTVVKAWLTARESGRVYVTTSGDNQVKDLIDEFGKFQRSEIGGPRVQVDRVSTEGGLPVPEEGVGHIVVGTMRDLKEAVLHEESRMLNRLGDAGATPEEVAALRGWFNEERPNIDEMAKIFDEAAARHNLDDRFDPFPDGKHIADEFDTLADGEESVLVPGGNEEAPPEEVELLQRVTDRFRAATALPADPLTAADFGKPEHTRGFWRVQVDAAVIEKLNRVEGPPITASDHALIERYGQRALAEWGPRRNSDWIKGHGDTAEEPYKTKTLASETTDKVMADSKKKSETRYQGVQQFLDLDAGVPVKANLPEGALHVSDAQLIGTRRLQDTEGHSGTGKVVEKELFERGIIKGPVTEIDPYYKSQVKHLQDLNFDTAHDKLQHLARSILRDAKVELVDRKGNVLAGEDGTVLIDDDGHVLDRNGHLVDHDGNVIDRDGTILVDRDGNVLVDKDGRMVDKAGNVLVDEDGTALVDRNGHLVDGDGNLVDRAGHVLVDRDGNVLVDRAGRVVGTDGRPVETDGCVAGVRMAGRDQVVGSFDNRNLRGDDIRIDKDGNQIELSGWTDKEGHDHTKGVVDWVDQLTDQQVRAIVACDARLTISEEFESAGVKLKYDVLDARFDDDHGCGDEAERVGKAIVDDFGNRNRHEAKLVFVNKSRMRGTDYKTIERAIAQGGLSGKFVGGAGYGERAVIQGDGRIGRGGKGPREAGGTPGTVQHWYSPEDYWAPVADHGVVRQVIHFQEAVETHRHAATAYREEPTPERRAALREANHDLKQAIRDLRRDASPTMQRVVDERLLSGERTRTHQANAPPTTSPNERNDELGRQEPLSRSGGHPPLGLVDRARLPLPPAAALRQRLDASAPGAAEYYALGDEQALGELTSRRDRLAEAVGWKPAEIEGAEGLRLVGAATTIAQHELAQALGVADSEVTVAKAQEVLGKAAARQPAGYDMHLTTGTNAGITDRAHAGPSVAGELRVDTAVADNQVAENPVPEDTVVNNTTEKTVADKTVAAASRYLANAALLDLVIHIFRHSRNRCVNNGVTAMRVLCPKNADRFTMPPGEIPLRGHNWATIKSSFRNGSHNLSRSLEQAVEPLKRRPGGIQVLVYKWKNSAEQDSDLADSHLVLLVNDSERDDEPNLVVVDLEASWDSTPDRAVGPGDLTDARALLDKAVEFGLWQREQQKFINNLSERGFWTIDFDRHGDLAPDSADQDTTRQKTHVPPQLVREIDDAGESVQADEPRVLAGVGSRPMDDGDAVAEGARRSDPVAEYFGSPAVRRYDNDYGLEREVGEDGRPLPPEGIFASVDKHGILRMQVRASARTPRGFAMVAQMEAEIGHLVTGIQDYWTDAYDGLTTNIDRFNALLREHPDMTPEEAAGRTFTGRMAARRGFTDIRCDHLDGVRGYHHNVIVTFTRPEASRHGDRPTRTSSEPAGTQPHRTNEPEAPAPGSVAAVIAGEGPGMPAAAKAHEIVTAFGEEKQKQVPLFGSMFERLLGKDSLQSVKAVRKLIDDPEIVRWLDLLVARRDPDVSETMHDDRGAERDSPADGSSRAGAFDLVRDDGGERPVPDSSKLPLIGDLLDISPDETDDLVLTAVLKGLEGKYGPYYLFGLEAWYVKDARGIRWIEMNARIAGPGGRDIGSVARQFYRDEQGRLVALHGWLKLSEKAYRRRGFGKAFTEAMESYYRRSGVDRVRVHVLGEDGGLVWALAGFGWDPECLPDTLEMITARIAQLQSRVSEKDAELLGRYLRLFEGAPRPVETYPTPYELATMKGEDPDLGAKLMRGSSWWGVKFLSSSTPAESAPKTGGEQTDGQSVGARPHPDAEPDATLVRSPLDGKDHGLGAWGTILRKFGVLVGEAAVRQASGKGDQGADVVEISVPESIYRTLDTIARSDRAQGWYVAPAGHIDDYRILPDGHVVGRWPRRDVQHPVLARGRFRVSVGWHGLVSHEDLAHRSWRRTEEGPRIARLADVYTFGQEIDISLSSGIKEYLLDPARPPLSEKVIAPEIRETTTMLASRLSAAQLSDPEIVRGIRLAAEGLFVNRTLYGDPAIGRANHLYDDAFERREFGVRAFYHNGMDIAADLGHIVDSALAETGDIRQVMLAVVADAWSDAVYGRGRRNDNPTGYDERSSAELLRRRAVACGYPRGVANILAFAVDATGFDERTKTQMIASDEGIRELRKYWRISAGQMPVALRNARWVSAADLQVLSEPDALVKNIELALEDLMSRRFSDDRILGRALSRFGRHVTTVEDALDFVDWLDGTWPDAFRPRGTEITLRQAIIDRLLGSAVFTHPDTGYRPPDGWLLGNREMRRDHAAKHREIAYRLRDDPTCRLRAVYRDAHEHADAMRRKYAGHGYELVIRPDAHDWNPSTIAKLIPAALRPAGTGDVRNVLRVIRLVRAVTGADSVIVLTWNKAESQPRLTSVHFEYSRPNAQNADPGPSTTEVRRALSVSSYPISIGTTDLLSKDGEPVAKWHRIELGLAGIPDNPSPVVSGDRPSRALETAIAGPAETAHSTTEPEQANAVTPPEVAAPKHEPSPTPWSTGSAVGDDPPSTTTPAEDASAARPAESHSGRPEPTPTAMPFDEPGTQDEPADTGSATVQENIPARPDALPDNGIGARPSDDHARAALTDLHELLGDSSLGATAAEVFSLVRLGMTHSEIATTLDLSERDVRAHLAGIRRKLGNRRARLVAAPRAAEPHMTPEFGLFRAAMYKALIGAEPPDPRQLIAEASPEHLERIVQQYDSSFRAVQNSVRGGARSRVAATMALLAARRVVSALADDHHRLQASLATALAEATPTELRTALDELSAADRQLLNQRFGPTPSPATFDPEGSVRDIRAVDIVRQVATRIASGATVSADSENSSATSIFQRELLGAEHDLPAAVQQVNSAATQTYSTNECLDAITEWVNRKDAAQANMVPAHHWRSLPVDHGFDDEQQRLADGALRAGGLDSADKLRRREQRPSMQDAQRHSNEIGRWWDSLSDPAEPGGLSKAQRALIQVYPQQIGNADGLPAVIRDHANRLGIRRELDEFVARKPVGVGMLAWLRTELTAAERKQFSNLVHVRNHLRQMDTQATEVPGSPPVHLLSYDSTAFHGNGKVVAALGNVDTAHTVNWHVPGTNTASNSLAYQFKPLRNLYEETLRVEPSLELASIIWIGYAAPTGPLNTGYAKAAFRRRARVGGIRLRCDIAAFHATRRRTGTADRSQLVNRLYGFSYGSTTTCYAGRDGRLAGLVHSVILAGSPGTGPLRRAAEFGIGADNVYIFGSWRDTVSKLGAGETGVQRLFYPVVGLGMDPARKTFGAVRLPAEFSDSLVSTGMVHRGYLDRDPATGQPNESLTSAAHITAGRGATLARAGHRRAGRWVVARPIDPERGRYANGNNDSAVGRSAVRTGDTEADEGGGRPRGSVGSGPEESAAEPSAPGSGSNFPSGGTTPPAEVLRPTPWSELGGQGDRAGAVASEPEVLIGRTEEPVAGSSARGSDVPLRPASGADEPGAARPADVDDAEAGPGDVPATHSPEGEGVEPTRSSTPWSSRETDAGSASEGSGVRPAASAGAHRAVPRRPEPSSARDAEDAHSQRTVAAARLRAVVARLGIASSEPGAAALEALRARAGRARESLAGLLGIAPSDLAVPQHLQQPVERLQDHLRSLDDAGWSQLAGVDPAALRSWLVEASRLQSDTQIATARAIEGDRTLADAVPGRRSAEAARLVDPTGVREPTAQHAGSDPFAELKRLTTVAGAEAARLAAAIVEYLETSSAVDAMTELLELDQVITRSGRPNPLLERTGPLGSPRLDLVEVSDIVPAANHAIRLWMADIADVREMIESPDLWSVEEIFERYLMAGTEVRPVWSTVRALAFSHPNGFPGLREAWVEITKSVSRARHRILTDEQLGAWIQNIYENRADLNLDAPRRAVLERVYFDFRNSGGGLSKEEKARIARIDTRMTELKTDFQLNKSRALEAAAVPVTESELGKLSADDPAVVATGGGGFLLQLDQVMTGSHQTLLRRVDDPGVRERVYKAATGLCRTGEFDNTRIAIEMIALRAERAALLGFPHHAACIANREHIDPEVATVVLRKLATHMAAAARREIHEAMAVTGRGALEPWDIDHALAGLAAQRHGLDDRALRPYLELNRVLTDGVFHLCESLFGLKVRARDDIPAHHPDVQVFEIARAGEVIGIVYFDPYRRPGKIGGAGTTPIMDKFEPLGRIPVSMTWTNIEKPLSSPTLLSWKEVESIFHEFGHVLNDMLGGGAHEASDRRLPRTWTEGPGEFFGILALQSLPYYAVHYETGDRIPPEMLETIRESTRIYRGLEMSRFMAHALLDLAWHRLLPGEIPAGDDLAVEVKEFEDAVLTEAGLGLPSILDVVPIQTFGHIFWEYDGTYYTYLWNKVLAHLVWEKVEQEVTKAGGFTRAIGKWLYENVYRHQELFVSDVIAKFLNRDTDLRPYLEANGLLEPSRSAVRDIEGGGTTASDDTERKPGDGAEAQPGAESEGAPPGHEGDPDNDRPGNDRADTSGLLGSPRVVVFGPAVIDVVVEYDELPAAGEYRRVRSFREVVGGKALNQAVAAARLGARVAMVSAIGSDGDEIRQTLRREGIGDAGVRIENDVPSEKVACLVGPDGEPSFVFHAPPELDLTGDDVGSNIAAIENADFVLLTPRLPYSVVARTASVARRLGVTVVLQPPLPREPSALDAVRMADVLVPNETEARALLSAASIDADTTPGEELPERLFELLGVPTIIVTLGAAGCVVHHQGRTELFRAHPTRVVDTTGASDAFTAALAMGLNAGLPVDHAVRIGLSASAHTVAQLGGSESMPYVHQVDLALPGGPPDDTLFHQ